VLLGALPETRPAALLTAPFAGNPRHDHNLWVMAVVRPIRFHDLRHTTGSLLTMRGANTGFVQRIMRHSETPEASAVPALLVNLRARRVFCHGIEIPTRPPNNLQRQALLYLAALARTHARR